MACVAAVCRAFRAGAALGSERGFGFDFRIAVIISRYNQSCYNQEKTIGPVARDFRALLRARRSFVYDPNRATERRARRRGKAR